MKDGTLKALWAMSLLAGLEAVTLIMRGPDGALLAATVAAIAGLGGFVLARRAPATANDEA